MDHLPDELLLYILSFLTPRELTLAQSASRRVLVLTRDNNLWRAKCFDESYAEQRRQRLLCGPPPDPVASNAPLLRALAGLLSVPEPGVVVHNESAPNAEVSRQRLYARAKARALANWDPSFPDEKINYYQEYIERHADVSLSWFESVSEGTTDAEDVREATGTAILYHQNGTQANKLYAALDDGSIGVWEIQGATENSKQGRLVARSPAGHLIDHDASKKLDLESTKGIMTAIGAIECVSIDQGREQGFFAVQDRLVQIDLRSLQTISTQRFPYAISALSEVAGTTPMTVGTNMSIHMHDPRQRANFPSAHQAVRLELIAGPSRLGLHSYNTMSQILSGGHGTPAESYATLSQPGPLSVVHVPESDYWDGNGSIWVSGRFTSLLNYDRRYFPRLRGSVHSGARISCLRLLPHPFLPPNMSFTQSSNMSISTIQEAKSIQGNTLLAAGEYKGKGSLEMYGLSSDPDRGVISSDYRGTAQRANNTMLQNRQTAGSTKLLSACGHGGKIVYSDGDGNVKWVERDGFTPVRIWNINNASRPGHSSDQGTLSDALDPGIHDINLTRDPSPPDDIVQLLLPTMPKATQGHNQIGEDNLVVWTGDGHLGMIGFGKDARWRLEDGSLKDEAEDFADRAKRREERQLSGLMERALRRQQDELNFMRSFGMGG